MIPILRCVALAFTEVRVNRLRSTLMIVCVAAAVATMTLVTQMGATAEQELTRTIARTQGLAGTVRVDVSDTSRDVQLEVLEPEGIAHAAGRVVSLGDALLGADTLAKAISVPVAAVDPALMDWFANDLTSGRVLVEDDRDQALLPVVLGPQAAQFLRDGLGAADTAALNGVILKIETPQPTYLQVVGILADGPLARLSDRAGAFVPLGRDGIAAPLRSWAQRSDTTAPESMSLYLNDPVAPQAALRDASALVKARLAATGETRASVSGERVDTSADFATATRTMSAMMRSIGLAVLAIGITAVAIVSMMSLRERAGELALRRAMGTEPRSLSYLVLIENVLIVTLGALLGLAVAAVVGVVLTSWDPGGAGAGIGRVQTATAASALGVTVVMGVLLSLVPARRASRQQIMDVLGA